jgi:hypothetical protein
MTSHNSRLSLDEVLDHFFLTADKPTQSLVLRACEEYPEYRKEIVEYAALWAAYEASPEPADDFAVEVTDEEVTRLQSFVMNRLYELDGNRPSDSEIAEARTVLNGLSGGKQLRQAAQAAGLERFTGLLTKVLSKRITNVPLIIIGALAHYLNIHRNALEQTLGSQITGSFSYKSADKPNGLVTETWEQAIASLSATDDEKSRLLALQGREDSF